MPEQIITSYRTRWIGLPFDRPRSHYGIKDCGGTGAGSARTRFSAWHEPAQRWRKSWPVRRVEAANAWPKFWRSAKQSEPAKTPRGPEKRLSSSLSSMSCRVLFDSLAAPPLPEAVDEETRAPEVVDEETRPPEVLDEERHGES